MDVFDLTAKITLDISNYLRGLDQARGEANGFSSALGGGLATAAKVGVAAVGAASSAAVAFGQSAIDSAIQYESAFTGVRKTVDATQEEFEELSAWIKDASTKMASSQEVIAGTMEIAGQLGVDGVEGLEKFTETMIMLGDTTNLSAEEAASALARFGNIAGLNATDMDRVGSVIVALGNNFATTEADIVQMSTRLASAGTIAGFSATDILALSTAMSSVGINAEAGGTAMSTIMTKIGRAVDEGVDPSNEKLILFAETAGMSAEEFAAAWKTSPTTALQGFIKGLDGVIDSGGNVTGLLDDLGIKGIRETNTVKSLALASNVLTGAVDMANTAFEDNVALQKEASLRYGTTESQAMQMANAFKNLRIAIGEELQPVYGEFMSFSTGVIQAIQQSFDEGGLDAVVNNLGSILVDVIASMASYIPNIISLGSQFVGSFIGSLWEKVPDMIDTGIVMLSSFAEGAQEAIPQFLAEILPRIMELTGRLREKAGELVDAGLNIILDLLQGIINGLPEMLTYIPTIISNIAGIINDNMSKIVAAGIELIMMLGAGIIDAAPTLIAEFPKIIKAIFDVITAVNWVNLGANVIKWIANGIKGLFNMIPNLFRDMGTNAINLFKGFDWLGLGRTIIQFIVNGIKGLVTSVPNALKSIGQSALNAIKVMDWWGVGSGIISGIASGISNGVGAIMDAARNAARNALNAAKNFLGIHSPSSVFRDQVGKMMALGLGEGFEDNIPVDDMKSGVEEAIDEISGLSAPQIGFDDEGNGTRRNGFFATFNIYTDPSQDKESIAREVQDKFLTWYEQETAIA